ncbi:protein-tyrosine phosphatase family protein [Providencia rettgeri]
MKLCPTDNNTPPAPPIRTTSLEQVANTEYKSARARISDSMSHIKNTTVPTPQNTTSTRSSIFIRDLITGFFSRQTVSHQQDGTIAPRYAFNSRTVDSNPAVELGAAASTLATQSVKYIDNFNKLEEFTKLQNFQYCDQQEVKGARFSDIKTAKETQVCITNSEGIQIGLPANRVKVGDDNLFIRSQSPKNIENHLQMLYENRTPMLCILSSNSDIRDLKLPPYFRMNGTYGRMEVKTKEIQPGDGKPSKIGSLNVKHYSMRLTYDKKPINIPVVHVDNWIDRTSAGTEELKELAKYMAAGIEEKRQFYEFAGSRAINDKDKLLPVIHCAAGVGRTGQVAAAMQLIKPNNELSVPEIIMDMRKTGCGKMVQKKEQFNELLKLETLLNAEKLAQ